MPDSIRPGSASPIGQRHDVQVEKPITEGPLDSFVLHGVASHSIEMQRPIAPPAPSQSSVNPLPPLSDPRWAVWEKAHPIETKFYQLRANALADARPPRVVVQLEMQGGSGDIAFGKKLKDKLEDILPAGSNVVFVGDADVIEAAKKFGYTVERLDFEKHANADVLIVAPLVKSKPRLAAKHVLHLVEYTSLAHYSESPREAHGQALLLGADSGYGGWFLDVPKISPMESDSEMGVKLSRSAAPGLRQRLRDAGTLVAMVYPGKAYGGSLQTLIEVAKTKPVVALVQLKATVPIPAAFAVIEHPDGLDESLIEEHPTSVHIVRASSMPHTEMVACLQSADLVFCTGDHTPVETLVCNPNAPWLHEMPMHKAMFVSDLIGFASRNGFSRVSGALEMGINAINGDTKAQSRIAPLLIDPEFRREWFRFAQAVTAISDVTLPLANAMLTCRTHEDHPQWRAAEDLLTLACRHGMSTQEALRLCVPPFDEQKMTTIWRAAWLCIKPSLFGLRPTHTVLVHQQACDLSMVLHAAIHTRQEDKAEVADAVWGELDFKKSYPNALWIALGQLDAVSKERACLWIRRFEENPSLLGVGLGAVEAVKKYPELRTELVALLQRNATKNSWILRTSLELCLHLAATDAERTEIFQWFSKTQFELTKDTPPLLLSLSQGSPDGMDRLVQEQRIAWLAWLETAPSDQTQKSLHDIVEKLHVLREDPHGRGFLTSIVGVFIKRYANGNMDDGRNIHDLFRFLNDVPELRFPCFSLAMNVCARVVDEHAFRLLRYDLNDYESGWKEDPESERLWRAMCRNPNVFRNPIEIADARFSILSRILSLGVEQDDDVFAETLDDMNVVTRCLFEKTAFERQREYALSVVLKFAFSSYSGANTFLEHVFPEEKSAWESDPEMKSLLDMLSKTFVTYFMKLDSGDQETIGPIAKSLIPFARRYAPERVEQLEALALVN